MVAPALSGKLDSILNGLACNFAPAAACLRASSSSHTSVLAEDREEDSDSDLEGAHCSCFLHCSLSCVDSMEPHVILSSNYQLSKIMRTTSSFPFEFYCRPPVSSSAFRSLQMSNPLVSQSWPHFVAH